MKICLVTFLLIVHPLESRRSKSKVDENADAISNDFSGMFIWRIEDFSPVPLPKNSYGSFHNEDSYIVLNSKMHEGRIHRGRSLTNVVILVLSLVSQIFITGSGMRRLRTRLGVLQLSA